MKKQKSAIFENKSLEVKTLMTNHIAELETIIIILVITKVLHKAYLIQDIVYLK